MHDPVRRNFAGIVLSRAPVLTQGEGVRSALRFQPFSPQALCVHSNSGGKAVVVAVPAGGGSGCCIGRAAVALER